MKASHIQTTYSSGLWVIRALVRGEIQEFAGKTLKAARRLYQAEVAR